MNKYFFFCLCICHVPDFIKQICDKSYYLGIDMGFLWAMAAAVIVHRNHFFCFYQQNKSSESKVHFRKTTNHGKILIGAAKGKSYWISAQLFGLILSVIDAFKWFSSRISS